MSTGHSHAWTKIGQLPQLRCKYPVAMAATGLMTSPTNDVANSSTLNSSHGRVHQAICGFVSPVFWLPWPLLSWSRQTGPNSSNRPNIMAVSLPPCLTKSGFVVYLSSLSLSLRHFLFGNDLGKIPSSSSMSEHLSRDLLAGPIHGPIQTRNGLAVELSTLSQATVELSQAYHIYSILYVYIFILFALDCL